MYALLILAPSPRHSFASQFPLLSSLSPTPTHLLSLYLYVNPGTIEGFCMACLMEKHAYQVLTQPGGTVVPREIFFNLKNIYPTLFSSYFIHIFFSFLFFDCLKRSGIFNCSHRRMRTSSMIKCWIAYTQVFYVTAKQSMFLYILFCKGFLFLVLFFSSSLCIFIQVYL